MKYMLFFLLIQIFIPANSINWYAGVETVYLKNAYIEGETNVNKFFFIYENTEHVVNSPIPEKMEIDIPIKQFKGENPMMLNDFQNLLKSSEHPYVKVEFGKSIFGDIAHGRVDNLLLNFTIAGVKREVRTSFQRTIGVGNSKIVTGSAYLHLTDFSLEPPEKFMGIIKVKDRVFIKFDIIFTESSS